MPPVGNSALARLIARSGLVDDVNAAFAANQLVVAMTRLQRLERILDLHGLARRYGPGSGRIIKARLESAPLNLRGS